MSSFLFLYLWSSLKKGVIWTKEASFLAEKRSLLSQIVDKIDLHTIISPDDPEALNQKKITVGQ